MDTNKIQQNLKKRFPDHTFKAYKIIKVVIDDKWMSKFGINESIQDQLTKLHNVVVQDELSDCLIGDIKIQLQQMKKRSAE